MSDDDRRSGRNWGGPGGVWRLGLAAMLAVFCVGLAVVRGVGPAGAQDTAAPEPNAPADLPARATNNADLDAWLDEAVDGVVSDRPGHWQFAVAERPVIVLTDELAGRMRIISPVGRVPDDKAELNRLLEANFHTALDARYAVWEGQLWCAYIHPLPTLTRDGFYNGVGQVVTLAVTTGTTYSSSGLRFGGGDEEVEPDGRGAM
ncbi:MAG: type III secretion system chaperone [Planctomycetota bacterium]